MKTFAGSLVLMFCFVVLSVFGGADARWFDEARYGVFIHYGAYAVAARTVRCA